MASPVMRTTPLSEEGAPVRNNRVRTRNRRLLVCGLATSAAGATGGYAPGVAATSARGDAMTYFLYKLVPPRPTFSLDMTDAESAIMADHVGYWTSLAADGTAVVFGAVADPAGIWGLAVVEAESEPDVRALGDADPAITSGLATYQVYPMPGAIARP